MDHKFLIYRIYPSGVKEYYRCKCVVSWTRNPSICWKFSKVGAKGIVSQLISNSRNSFYTYGFEAV